MPTRTADIRIYSYIMRKLFQTTQTEIMHGYMRERARVGFTAGHIQTDGCPCRVTATENMITRTVLVVLKLRRYNNTR